MSVQTGTHEGITIVTFCGCLLCDSGSLEQTLRRLAAEGAKILLDLGEVERLNSRTIGLLVAIHQAATRQGGAFWICNVNRKGVQLLEALKLRSILQIFDTRDAALAHVEALSRRSPRQAKVGFSSQT